MPGITMQPSVRVATGWAKTVRQILPTREKLDELAEQLQQLRDAAGPQPSVLSTQATIASPAVFDRPPNPVPLSQPVPQYRHTSHAQNYPVAANYHRSDEQAIESQTNLGNFIPALGPSQSPHIDDLVAPQIYHATPMPTARHLDCLKLDGEQIDKMFQMFFEQYHPYLDILDPSLSADSYYSLSPVLFWAIISVAARRYEDEPALMASLSTPVTTLIWRNIPSLPHSIGLIQAILLVCNWPFPTSVLSMDPSFILISHARSAAMQMGVHRPENMQDYLRTKRRLSAREITEAVKIWCAIYITAQGITSTLGHQSLFSSDSVVDLACNNNVGIYAISDNLHHQLLLQRFTNHVESSFMDVTRNNSRQSLEGETSVLMNVLERDYDDLETKLGPILSDVNHLLLLSCGLQLRSFYFIATLPAEFRKSGLLKAFATTMNLITAVDIADSKFKLLDHCPFFIPRILTIAATVLLKIINSSYSVSVDHASGKQAFNSCLRFLRRASVEDNDLPGKGSRVMTQLWGVHRSFVAERVKEPRLKLKSRLGASVLHDSLWTWREELGGQPDAYPLLSEASLRKESNGIEHGASEFGEMSSMLINELQNTDWMWDIGLSSLIPVDIDSMLSTLSNEP
ncbi:hypothetical protein MMC18_002892 [Xylographa bjoerkii]|nr:hypothetical protein [Xylographa bjoerkii]